VTDCAAKYWTGLSRGIRQWHSGLYRLHGEHEHRTANATYVEGEWDIRQLAEL
jgi:hypothetical protein